MNELEQAQAALAAAQDAQKALAADADDAAKTAAAKVVTDAQASLDGIKAKADGKGEAKFTQADMDRAVEVRLAQEKERERKRAEEIKRKADEDAATKNGEWKTVAESRATDLSVKDARIAELEGQIAKASHDALKSKVGEKHKLPGEVAARLQGETEAELDADAAKLARHIAPAQPGSIDPGRPALSGGDAAKRAIEEAKNSGRYAPV